jgi:predicted nucleic acid-binding protein
MRGYLLDTNIPSETLRPRPDTNVAAWLKSQVKDSQFLSVVTMGEFRKGATLLPLSDKRTQIEHFTDVLIPSWFAGRILPVTQAIAERWGVLEGQRLLTGSLLFIPRNRAVGFRPGQAREKVPDTFSPLTPFPPMAFSCHSLNFESQLFVSKMGTSPVGLKDSVP